MLPPRKNQGNTFNIDSNGKLSNRLQIVHYNTILETVAVAQGNMVSPTNDKFLIVRSQQFWLESFQFQMRVIGRWLYSELYQESGNIDDMIENDDDYIINKDSEYSGENSTDGQMLEEEEDTTTGEKNKA